MCKKLIVLLVVLGLSVPVMADYIGFGNPLKVDNTLAGDAQVGAAGYQDWDISRDWTGPIGKDMDNPLWVDPWEIPHVQLEAFRANVTPDNTGGARNRNGGMAFTPGTGEFNATGKGLGMNYLKLTVTGLAPETSYKVVLWGVEQYSVWSMSTANPDSKFGIWSTVNPVQWLTDNGWGPGGANTSCTLGGYGPKWRTGDAPTTDTNMPCDMKNVVLNNGDRFNLQSGGPGSADGNNPVGDQSKLNAKICDVMTTSGGALTLYGWMDATDWSGSMHIPLNGFMIVPEPMTVALLGLGGLALIRRKRA